MGGFARREPQWIRRSLLEKMAGLVLDRGLKVLPLHLFIFTYAFLLRLPSEALPAEVGRAGHMSASNCMVYLEDDALVVVLRRRKNKVNGSTLRRKCWCHTSAATCPVHVIGPLLTGRAIGETLFPGISQRDALCTLRWTLAALGLRNAAAYRTHDLRRGHAQDLAESG